MQSGHLLRGRALQSTLIRSGRSPSHILNPEQILEDKKVCAYDAYKPTSQEGTMQQLPAHFLQKGNYIPQLNAL